MCLQTDRITTYHFNMNYSVLMSVYKADNPTYLRESIESVMAQTIPCDDFVIVCDGPLTNELNNVLSSYPTINIIRYEQNEGLGKALSKGIMECRHELVARMDSDDVAAPNRMELQLEAFKSNPELSMVSGTVSEFCEDIEHITGARKLPLTDNAIRVFSRKRNPFNHPSMMFKKSAVLSSGNYDETYHLFEDYYLWVRMLMAGYKGANLEETLVYMRVDSNTMLRRGGASYAKDMLRFHGWLRKEKWSSISDYITGALPHALICILPAGIRKGVYKRLH